MHTVLESIATANPPYKRSQAEFATFMTRIEGIPESIRDRIPAIYARSGIDYRYFCLSDYCTEAEAFEFYPNNWELSPAPTTGDRNREYKTHALDLAERVAHQAIWQANLLVENITHLIVVSCTGFFAPGLDIHLVKRLGLPASTDRTLIGFMGCNGAFNGLKTAHAICQSNPTAKVLLVCVELCSLHFQGAETLEKVIINTIFSDGAAAVVLLASNSAADKLTYTDSACLVTEDSLDAMTWDIGDTGFLMQLSPQVPQLIKQNLPAYLDTFLGRHGLKQDLLDFWAVHPGGRQVLDQVQAGLSLPKGLLKESYEVLRRHGNMSSPTILFILKLMMESSPSNPSISTGIALGFGPGLSIEGALFQRFAA